MRLYRPTAGSLAEQQVDSQHQTHTTQPVSVELISEFDNRNRSIELVKSHLRVFRRFPDCTVRSHPSLSRTLAHYHTGITNSKGHSMASRISLEKKSTFAVNVVKRENWDMPCSRWTAFLPQASSPTHCGEYRRPKIGHFRGWSL